MTVKTSVKKIIERHAVGDNVWLRFPTNKAPLLGNRPYLYNVLDSEEAVGSAMFDELVAYSNEKAGDINIILLGGRGAQAMYRLINKLASTDELDDLLARLNVFTQDALSPMRMNNGLSFVRDFERLLGPKFFAKIKSFTPMQTDTDDIEAALGEYLEKLDSLGGIDLFFLGLGPEAGAASHVCYIKPGCGAGFDDFAGIIPISASILEHHIRKFRAGGSDISADDEAECRAATHILTLGPAAILGAKRIVQSIVDASTAPAKKASFQRLVDTELSTNSDELQGQADENPGLLIRLHSDAQTYILPDLIA
jgi:6-phosphogluconolactonase/glucosamine-6-phosphate isomerase/deaminase